MRNDGEQAEAALSSVNSSPGYEGNMAAFSESYASPVYEMIATPLVQAIIQHGTNEVARQCTASEAETLPHVVPTLPASTSTAHNHNNNRMTDIEIDTATHTDDENSLIQAALNTAAPTTKEVAEESAALSCLAQVRPLCSPTFRRLNSSFNGFVSFLGCVPPFGHCWKYF